MKPNKGFRPDLGVVVKSTMEANVGRYLNATTGSAEYEPLSFNLSIKKQYAPYFPPQKKTTSYTPDWKDGNKVFWEVKGDWTKFHRQDEDIAKVLMAVEQYGAQFGIVQGRDIRISSSIPDLGNILKKLNIQIVSYWDLERLYSCSRRVLFWEALHPWKQKSHGAARKSWERYLDIDPISKISPEELEELKEDAQDDEVAAFLLRQYRCDIETEAKRKEESASLHDTELPDLPDDELDLSDSEISS